MRPLPITAALCLALSAFTASAQVQRIAVTANEAAKRVDVTIDGKPFTSYLWPSTQKKPVLYPLLSARGTAVCAWLPSRAAQGRAHRPPPPRRPLVQPWRRERFRLLEQLRGHHGRTRRAHGHHPSPSHRRGDGRERSRRARRGDGMDRRRRHADHSRTDALCVPRRERHAQHRSHHDADGDRAEGAVSRQQRGHARHCVARELEQPESTAEATVSGLYVSSAGKRGDAVWGTRGPWTLLGGRIAPSRSRSPFSIIPATRAIRRTGHAPGYGLFAATWGRERNLGRHGGDPAPARAWPVGYVPLSRADPERHSRHRAHRAGIERSRRLSPDLPALLPLKRQHAEAVFELADAIDTCRGDGHAGQCAVGNRAEAQCPPFA